MYSLLGFSPTTLYHYPIFISSIINSHASILCRWWYIIKEQSYWFRHPYIIIIDIEGLEQTKIISDASTSYNGLPKNYTLESKVISKQEVNVVLPWVHKAISNAKRMFLDVHHRIDDDFLQSYLNEFCFKFNRRYFDNVFDRLMIAAVSYRWNYLGEEYG